MNILIATGIFKPEIGGPATHASGLACELKKAGHRVMVITYSDKESYEFDENFGFEIKRIKRKNLLFNYFVYFIAVLKNINRCDAVYALDYSSAGLPSLLAAKLKRKKIAVRIGGDWLWERHLSGTGEGITLRNFYKNKIYKKQPFKFFLAKFFFRNCGLIIFNSKLQGEIFKEYYKINENKIKYLYNPINNQINIGNRNNVNKEIIWAGRMEEKNNIRRLVKVFCEMKVNDFNLVMIGEGKLKVKLINYVKENKCINVLFRDKVSSEVLAKILKESYGMIFPSYTDISPNLVLECLSVGAPFVLTKEHGLDWLRGKAIEFNPESEEEIKVAVEKMLKEDFEENFKNSISKINYNYGYCQAAQDTVKFLKESKL